MAVEVRRLTPEYAAAHQPALEAMTSTVPGILPSTIPELFSLEKTDCALRETRWYFSLVLVKDDQPIGLAMGYLGWESNFVWQELTREPGLVFLEILVVDQQYQKQGYGRKLLESFLDNAFTQLPIGSSRYIGYELAPRQPTEERLKFALQTLGSRRNRPVIRFYKQFGFTVFDYKKAHVTRWRTRRYATMIATWPQIMAARRA